MCAVSYIWIAVFSIGSIVSRRNVWVVAVVIPYVVYMTIKIRIIRIAMLINMERMYRDKELYIAEDTEYRQYVAELPEKTEREKRRKKYLTRNLDLTRTDFHYQTDDHRSFVNYLEERYPSTDKKNTVYWYYRAKSSFLEGDLTDAEYSAREYERIKDTFSHKAQHQADQIFGLPISIILSICGNRAVDRKMVERYGRSANKDPERWLWIGLYYVSVNDRNSAERCWKHLIARGKDYNDARYARKYIDSNDTDIVYTCRSVSELKTKNSLLIGISFFIFAATLWYVWIILKQMGAL